MLGSFLFTGDDVFKKVQVLSGGEKSRLALAKMLLVPANLVVLDEPTNHLDMRSKAVLQEALLGFDGSIIVVSHDRDFLDPLVTSVVEFRNGSLRSYPGNVSDYLEARSRVEEPSVEPAAGGSPAPVQERDRKRREAELRQERYGKTRPLYERLHAVEESIRKEEEHKAELERHMTDPGLYREPDRIREINAGYREIGLTLQSLYDEWALVSEELEHVIARYETARDRR